MTRSIYPIESRGLSPQELHRISEFIRLLRHHRAWDDRFGKQEAGALTGGPRCSNASPHNSKTFCQCLQESSQYSCGLALRWALIPDASRCARRCALPQGAPMGPQRRLPNVDRYAYLAKGEPRGHHPRLVCVPREAGLRPGVSHRTPQDGQECKLTAAWVGSQWAFRGNDPAKGVNTPP